MKSTEVVSLPFSLDSPVEFVLVGTQGKKRAVVAKSKGAQIDLVAYAQRDSFDEHRMLYRSPFSFMFPSPMQLYPLTVDSPPVSFPSNRAIDTRNSEFTLVWRGAAYAGRQVAEIRHEFARRTEAIAEAVEAQSAAQLEWALSSVIDQCHREILEVRGNLLRRAYSFRLFLLVYIIGIIAYLVFSFTQ